MFLAYKQPGKHQPHKDNNPLLVLVERRPRNHLELLGGRRLLPMSRRGRRRDVCPWVPLPKRGRVQDQVRVASLCRDAAAALAAFAIAIALLHLDRYALLQKLVERHCKLVKVWQLDSGAVHGFVGEVWEREKAPVCFSRSTEKKDEERKIRTEIKQKLKSNEIGDAVRAMQARGRGKESGVLLILMLLQ